ncbi:MAG: DUF4332 domain-containing protein [Candidatus Marinimicrobia bacterium]|nr:DUF4332 domain-containing protein [Candidatus Neomarinimicrobiota bacterium]MCF7829327.1 DUF4332 domain-containing protein [Candidatus Neomarinimicrobiota bacterium]MCF7880011.1 DUF4332 domain-containing protein [Candidatus Neomarinimicrobiota bacterium]
MEISGNHSDVTLQSTRHPWWWLIGVALLAAGLYFLIADIPQWNVVWYAFAWYGYLLVVDAVIFWRQRHSFLSHRRRELLEMLFWSVPFWFLFEAYNFVIKNWYYAYALHSDWNQGVFAWFSFATVLPACFFHAELIKSFGFFTGMRTKSVPVEKGLQQFFLWFGAACVMLPLIFPTYTFWMVWGATLGIPDYINYKNGAPSILGDLKNGRPGRLYRLLSGGILAGIVWEGLNYWARCKWIYTVPGLEELKLFEMPVMGFLGFPVLALEAFALYTMFSYYFRGTRTWEASDENQKQKSLSPWYWPAGVIAMALSVLVYVNLLDITLQSRRPVFPEYQTLSTADIHSLESQHIQTPEQLWHRISNKGVTELAAQMQLNAAQLDSLYKITTLALHKGMGVKHAYLLRSIGINEVTDLINEEAEQLYPSLETAAVASDIEPPRLSELQVWIRAAEMAGGYKR